MMANDNALATRTVALEGSVSEVKTAVAEQGAKLDALMVILQKLSNNSAPLPAAPSPDAVPVAAVASAASTAPAMAVAGAAASPVGDETAYGGNEKIPPPKFDGTGTYEAVRAWFSDVGKWVAFMRARKHSEMAIVLLLDRAFTGEAETYRVLQNATGQWPTTPEVAVARMAVGVVVAAWRDDRQDDERVDLGQGEERDDAVVEEDLEILAFGTDQPYAYDAVLAVSEEPRKGRTWSKKCMGERHRKKLLQEHDAVVMVDSGASHNVARRAVVERVGARIVRDGWLRVSGFDGVSRRVRREWAELRVMVAGAATTARCLVLDNVAWGSDFGPAVVARV
ncbi:hypothetical protein AMAG_13738 [Allomyces macrogynus ATCC 38327]|uniref:Uncharacterized protein n=1 Tax=Allomyces macrogynus (strain ATCC 38327) TaxID=578462 RepID=A0A0L0T3Q4_ALLM3|nr:hypothetical protein AMAG_13738 [Allomyces macrogynus ATCC 38327]|eukprot:KNE69372.1 hypothetical protein AMAG_13738 [Allomyces macrogynus ATCC 38327]